MPGARINERVIFAKDCEDCPIGAAHARGEVPDVTAAALVRRVEEDDVSSAKSHEYRGVKMTTRELAETPEAIARELSQKVIGVRLAKGWTVEETLTTGLGLARGAAEKTPPKRAPRPADPVERRRAMRTPEQVAEEARLDAAGTSRAQSLGLLSTHSSASAAELLRLAGFEVLADQSVPAGRMLLVRGAP